MIFEDEILFPSFQEDEGGELGEEESDPLEDDELEGDEKVEKSEPDEDLDDDLGIEKE